MRKIKMEYYGNNDWRDYVRRQNTLAHFGIPKRSGRYPWGSGENPYHHGEDAPGGRKIKKRSLNDRAMDILKRKIDDGTATRFERWQYDRAMKKSNAAKEKRYQDRLQEALENLYEGVGTKEDMRLASEHSARELTSEDAQMIRDRMNGKPNKLTKSYFVPDKDLMEAYDRLHSKDSPNKNKEYEVDVKKLEKVMTEVENNMARTLSGEEKKQIDYLIKSLDSMGSSTEKDKKLRQRANDVKKTNTDNIRLSLSDAKERDVYDLNFLEAIQNKQILADGYKNERIKAYKEYLKDPEDFWKNKVNKYKDA